MKSNNPSIRVALVDDHQLLRTALASLINGFDNCKVIQQANSGQDLVKSISTGPPPDVVILDLNMPDMNGFDTATWLYQHHPAVHVLMLTMYDSELSLIRLLQCGVKGFLKKDVHPDELRFAIQSVMQAGYYYSNHTTGKLVSLFRNSSDGQTTVQRAMLSNLELAFLRLVCSDLTYKEIAQRMTLNPRSVDTLRDQLFTKMDVKSRVGLAIVALRHGLVSL